MIPTEDLLGEFDSIWNKKDLDKSGPGETSLWENLKDLISSARSVIERHNKYISEHINDFTDVPTLWWEGSDGWTEAWEEGETLGLEEYLTELITFGEELDQEREDCGHG